MAIQIINVSQPGDNQGDKLRDAFVKTNQNFAELVDKNLTIEESIEELTTIIDDITEDLTIKDDVVVSLTNGKTLGRYSSGQTIPSTGWTIDQFIKNIAIEYLTPSITAFAIENQNLVIEVGTVISGIKNFTFTASNPLNIKADSISIVDVTNENTVLVSGEPTNSPVGALLPSTVKLTPLSHTWKIVADNTLNIPLEKSYSVNWGYRRFAGSINEIPTEGIDIRNSLINTSVINTTNSFTFQTGSVNKNFVVAIPIVKNLVKVLNTDTNDDLTLLFLLSESISSIPDVSGNIVDYKVYVASFASSYSSNNNVIVTLS
jgi:hypothetical protein